jgi:hypothetical protein
LLWFNALRTPMRANMVGPPDVATRIKASLTACHIPRPRASLGKLRDVAAGVLKGDELAPARQRDRIVKPTLPAAISQ